jgi:acyl-coenzyme A synthetase/AMP-(fatty) acid ligase
MLIDALVYTERTELPKTATGKIRRTVLRERVRDSLVRPGPELV